MSKNLIKYWYLILIAFFFAGAGLLLFGLGEESYIAVHDNLDLFVAQFQMMKNTGSFFAHNVPTPFLGGVSRDVLPSEWSLYSLLYVILPSYQAYITGYFIKIIIALISGLLLAKEWIGEKWKESMPLIVLVSFAYGCLNLFPAYGIPFASIPLVLWLLIRIYRKPSPLLYVGLFCYPFLSYFSYFGLFLLGYLVIGAVWLSIRDRKPVWRLFLAFFVLAAGCMAFEYRLFGMMLFDQTETIRVTMVEADLTIPEILEMIYSVWKDGIFHADGLHKYIILPVCLLGFIWNNVSYLRKRQFVSIWKDSLNLIMLVIVFNCVVYGIYFQGDFRRLVEMILPPLKGWQFNRTIFFNPFLWYAGFFLVLKQLAVWKKPMGERGAVLLALAAIGVILLTPGKYNDLYATAKNHALRIVKGKEAGEMNYREFYSASLFEQVKKDIGYEGEWSAAYGFHPAVLEYNGIATLDGYLGFYPQSYKEAFRKIIAPALERVEESRVYFDTWGARAYLYSGTDLSTVSSYKNAELTDYEIYLDGEAFRELGGRYIFSRFRLSHPEKAGLSLVNSYREEGAPYEIYLYECKAGR